MQNQTIFDVDWLATALRRLVAPFAFLFLVIYDVRFVGLIVLMVALSFLSKIRRPAA